MSELRSLTKALRSFDARMTGIEDCLVEMRRSSEENSAGIEQAIKQLSAFQGKLWEYLERLDERQESAAKTRQDDITEVKGRLNKLETLSSPDEVTQS